MSPHDGKTREPLRRVLVPTDFSKGAKLAFGRAFLLPLAEDAEVHVVHVASPGLPAKERPAAAIKAKRALENSVSRIRRNAKRGPTIRVMTAVLSGEPFVEIIRYSRKMDAELIVIGRHGRRPVRDMFIGTTAERVIRKGDVPVLAVNLEPAGPYRRPLIASDLKDTTPRVFALALRIVAPAITTVHVVHAFNVPFEGFVNPTSAARQKSEYRRSFQDAAKEGLTKLLARYEPAGVQWKTMIRAGDARWLILTEAARSRADVIALGTHGRSGVVHALVGSVAEWVISQAPCDVLVARPARFTFELP